MPLPLLPLLCAACMGRAAGPGAAAAAAAAAAVYCMPGGVQAAQALAFAGCIAKATWRWPLLAALHYWTRRVCLCILRCAHVLPWHWVLGSLGTCSLGTALCTGCTCAPLALRCARVLPWHWVRGSLGTCSLGAGCTCAPLALRTCTRAPLALGAWRQHLKHAGAESSRVCQLSMLWAGRCGGSLQTIYAVEGMICKPSWRLHQHDHTAQLSAACLCGGIACATGCSSDAVAPMLCCGKGSAVARDSGRLWHRMYAKRQRCSVETFEKALPWPSYACKANSVAPTSFPILRGEHA